MEIVFEACKIGRDFSGAAKGRIEIAFGGGRHLVRGPLRKTLWDRI
jgi:hypothetical protein